MRSLSLIRARVALALAAIASTCSFAGAATCGPVSPARAAGTAPDACDVVVVIDGAAKLASTEAGRGTLRVLEEMGLFADTSIAWAELASALGMTPMGALEAVAGSRTMLMATRQTTQSPAGWALLTEVSGETERLIRARLKPVPRQIVDGQPVLMLENGRFLLATRRDSSRSGADRDSNRKERRTTGAAVLVAPADSPALFEACLPILTGKPAPHPIEADADSSRALDDHPYDAFILYRARVSAEPDSSRTLASVGATAGAASGPGAWTTAISCAPSFIGDADRVRRSRIHGPLFRAMSDGAIIAIGAPVSDAREQGTTFARTFYRFLSDVAPLFEGSGVVAVRGGNNPISKPGSEILIAATLKDRDDIAGAIDAGMASLINRLSRAELAGVDAQDFGGHFPGAVREATLTARSLSFLTPLIGPAPVARWCAIGLDNPSSPGWWLLSIADAAAPSGTRTLRTVGATLAPDADGHATDWWTTVGIVRPAQAIAAAPPVLATLIRPLSPLHWVQSIEWHAAIEPDGLVRGQSLIEFRAEAVAE